MERIQVDFAMQRGHEMIVQRDPPFARADLDEVDLQMLQAERPPGLLAIDWFEMDGSVTFRYAIDGRKLLPHRLITGSFGMKAFISLMLGIVEALDNCGHYLLRESCCLLDEKFLFVGGDWRDAALTYVPLREPPLKKPVREELLSLAVRLMGKVDRVDGDAVQAVLRLLDDPAASWSPIRVGLLRLLASDQHIDAIAPNADSAHAYRTASDAARPDAGGLRAYGALPAEAGWPGTDEASPHAETRTGESADAHHATDGGEEPGSPAKSRFDLLRKMMRREEPADAPPPETSMFDDREWPGTTGPIRDAGRARWMSACGAILAVALIWRYIYLPSPGTDRLLISLGATLLAGGGFFLLWQRLAARKHQPFDDAQSTGGHDAGSPGGGFEAWRPDAESGSRSGDAGTRTDAAELRFPWLTEFAQGNGPASNAVYAGLEDSIADRWAGQSSGVPEVPGLTGMAQAAGPDGAETEQLQDETVLLGQYGGGKFWLVREHEGQHRRFPVETGMTVIGRSESHARIVDTAEGVSRAHLEIEFDGAQVRIKDLASRNGTLLEGEIMIPYKEYALRDGGMFRLAGPDGPKYTLRRGG